MGRRAIAPSAVARYSIEGKDYIALEDYEAAVAEVVSLAMALRHELGVWENVRRAYRKGDTELLEAVAYRRSHRVEAALGRKLVRVILAERELGDGEEKL